MVFGTVDTWLTWQLTDGAVHATDATNAARTMLYNIHTQAWDDELLAMFNIPLSMLPEVHNSSEVIGQTSPMAFFGGQVPIALEKGMVKNTYGAGAFMIMNTGEKPVMSNNRLVTTIAYQVDDKPVYALEGSIFSAGTAIQWLHDRLGLIETQLDGYELATMKADGSVSRNPYLMQFQADIAHVEIERSLDEDATPLGAAFLAGLAVGYWQDLSDLQRYVQAGRQFKPSLAEEQRQHLRQGWRNAIKATQFFGEI